ALGVVSRRRGDDPARPLARVEAEDLVQRAALLERPGHLQVLELEERTVAGDARERFGIRERRHVDRAGDPGARRLDVRDRDHLTSPASGASGPRLGSMRRTTGASGATWRTPCSPAAR